MEMSDPLGRPYHWSCPDPLGRPYVGRGSGDASQYVPYPDVVTMHMCSCILPRLDVVNR